MSTIREIKEELDTKYTYYSKSTAEEQRIKYEKNGKEDSQFYKKQAIDNMLEEIYDVIGKIDTDICRKYGYKSVQYAVKADIDDAIYEYLNYTAPSDASVKGVCIIPSFPAIDTVAKKAAHGGTYTFTYSYPEYRFEVIEHKASHKEERGTGHYTASYSSYDDKVHITQETKTVKVDDTTWSLQKYKKTMVGAVSFEFYVFEKGKLEELEKMIEKFNRSPEGKSFSEYSKLEKGEQTKLKEKNNSLKGQLFACEKEIKDLQKKFEKAKRWRPFCLAIYIICCALQLWLVGLTVGICLSYTIKMWFFIISGVISFAVFFIYNLMATNAQFKINDYTSLVPDDVSSFPVCTVGLFISLFIGEYMFKFRAVTIILGIATIGFTIYLMYSEWFLCTSLAEAEQKINEKKAANEITSRIISTNIEKNNNSQQRLAENFKKATESGEWRQTKRKVQAIVDFYASARL